MALKLDIYENCRKCGVRVAEGTNAGVKWNPSGCDCPQGEVPAPPRTVTWHSANLISACWKQKWVSNTIFLALKDDDWHGQKVEEGKWYWLDETWGLGGSSETMAEAGKAQLEYAKRL